MPRSTIDAGRFSAQALHALDPDDRHFRHLLDVVARHLDTLQKRRSGLRLQRVPQGGALLQRDLEIHALTAQHSRLSRLGTQICLGRFDRRDGSTTYVGWIGVRGDDGQPLLVDWRTPDAAPFFAATLREPFAESWPERLTAVGLPNAGVLGLPVHYRTPEVLLRPVTAVIRAARPTAAVPEAIRTDGSPHVLERLGPDADLVPAAVARAVGLVAGGGTAAVVARADRHRATGRPGVTFVRPEDLQGLEMDVVVVVEPRELWATEKRRQRACTSRSPARRGPSASCTRATCLGARCRCGRPAGRLPGTQG